MQILRQFPDVLAELLVLLLQCLLLVLLMPFRNLLHCGLEDLLLLCMGLVQLTKPFHFLAQFPNDFGIWVLVDNGMRLNAFGTVSKTQCGQSLFIVVRRGRNCSDHCGATVATQVLFEQPSEHTVTVGDEVANGALLLLRF